MFEVVPIQPCGPVAVRCSAATEEPASTCASYATQQFTSKLYHPIMIWNEYHTKVVPFAKRLKLLTEFPHVLLTMHAPSVKHMDTDFL